MCKHRFTFREAEDLVGRVVLMAGNENRALEVMQGWIVGVNERGLYEDCDPEATATPLFELVVEWENGISQQEAGSENRYYHITRDQFESNLRVLVY